MGGSLMQRVTALHLDWAVLARLIFAGSAWGLVLSTGFFVIALFHCGVPCPDDVAVVTAACVVTGIVTIGPIAAMVPPR
jgi:hypothetical protein